MPGRLTTHVLDTANGRPAAGLQIALWRLEPRTGERAHIITIFTNSDGRADAPLLVEPDLTRGTYEMVFAVGRYFAAGGTTTGEPPFLDDVPVRFGIADPTGHYHVPLLVSPWAYSTYRGS
jgi:5-hydroxyisourate hydrolase